MKEAALLCSIYNVNFKILAKEHEHGDTEAFRGKKNVVQSDFP